MAQGDASALVAMLMGERQQLEATVAQLSAPREAISTTQLEALEGRLEALHAAQLLTDDELGRLEDCVADGIEAIASFDVVTMEVVNASDGARRLHKLISLGEMMPKDGMFARQARRKFGAE